MKIERTESGMAKVFTPYNKDFVEKIKTIGGRKWNADEKCWMVPGTEIETVRQFMMEVYGETDKVDDAEKVTVKVTFEDDAEAERESIILFGKSVIRAYGRDSGATVCPDVTLLDGKIKSGGSMRYWKTIALAGTTIKVRNVSKTALAMTGDYKIAVEEIQEDTVDVAALNAEKEKLLARLAEIEKLLAEN